MDERQWTKKIAPLYSCGIMYLKMRLQKILKKGENTMKTLHDIRNYAREKGMSEARIERLIDEVESDGSGNIPDEKYYEDFIFGIDCETEGI